MKAIDWKFIAVVFLVWRILTFLGELIGWFFLPFKYSFPYVDSVLQPTSLPQWLWQWGNFDGVHYLGIIANGYQGYGVQVFFPFYPIAAWAVSLIVPSNLLSALLVSHVAIFVAAGILYRLVVRNFDTNVARWTILFLFFFPTSFFFGAVYTESLFLLLILLAFKTKGWWSAVFGLLAGGTRLVGAFIAPARILLSPRNWWSIFSLGGLGAFMIYLWARFSDPMIFLTAQNAFRNNRADTLTMLVNPFQVIFRYLKIFITADPGHFDFWVAVLEFSALLFGIGVLTWLWFRQKKLRSYLIFAWLALLLPTLSGTLSSMPRYLLIIFPIFIGLAQIRNKPIKYGVLAVFIILLVLLTCLFTRGYFIA